MKTFCLVIFLVLVVPIYGIWTWSDCSDPATRVIEITNFDISPKPLMIPGNATATVTGTILHPFGDSYYSLNVKMDKKLLGHWHTMPCNNMMGTCKYDDFCEILQYQDRMWKQWLPDIGLLLVNNSFTFTCPFLPANFNIHRTGINIPAFNEAEEPIADGDFRKRIELFNGQTMVGCVSLEISIKVPCHSVFCG